MLPPAILPLGQWHRMAIFVDNCGRMLFESPEDHLEGLYIVARGTDCC